MTARLAIILTLTVAGSALAGPAQWFHALKGQQRTAAAGGGPYTPAWITPIMTDSNAPEGLCDASSVYSGSYKAWYAMDSVHSFAQSWFSSTVFPSWLRYYLGVGTTKACKQARIGPHDSVGPNNLTIDGSQDGSAWTTLYSGVGSNLTVGKVYQVLFTNNFTAYAYYRLNATNGYGSYVGVSEWDLSTMVDMPPMTATNAPSPIVLTTSSDEAGMEVWRAFDNDMTTHWQTSGAFGTQQWVQVNFGSPRVVDLLAIRSYASAGPNAIRMLGSADGASWSTLFQTNAANTTIRQAFILGNSTAYQYYRMVATNTYHASVIAIYDIRMQYTP